MVQMQSGIPRFTLLFLQSQKYRALKSLYFPFVTVQTNKWTIQFYTEPSLRKIYHTCIRKKQMLIFYQEKCYINFRMLQLEKGGVAGTLQTFGKHPVRISARLPDILTFFRGVPMSPQTDALIGAICIVQIIASSRFINFPFHSCRTVCGSNSAVV